MGHARDGRVRPLVGVAFGLLGGVAALGGTVVNRLVDPHLLLLGFAVVMGAAATGMLLRARGGDGDGGDGGAGTSAPGGGHEDVPARAGAGAGGEAVGRAGQGAGEIEEAGGGGGEGRPGPLRIASPGSPPSAPTARRRTAATVTKVTLAALGVGFLTGLFGVGGGFVIVPALVLTLGLPMPAAVGTSLLVIAINSAASLAARAGQAHLDWAVVLPLTLTAVAGSVVGRRIAGRLPGATLTRAFAVLLLAVAACVAAGSLLELT
ncbi:hypothetical protein GCM10017673_19670 [Streptosporangium violaceochromogenes]|nr:hypothetical protein GCM10017673_19670 [Streptosporangium violaceochromogenes]